MNKQIYRLPLQFFGEETTGEITETETANDVDFGVAFKESSDESESQEPSVEIQGEGVEPATQQAEEIPNEVWKKARLKAEREAQAKIQQAQEEFNNSFADDEYLGRPNPYTGKAIRTKQDQQEYLEAYSKETLKSSGLDENIIQNMINNNPIIQEAQALKAQIQHERGQSQLQKEIELISELNPEIKTFDDFVKLPNRENIDKLVIERGMSLSEAYKLANFEELIGKKTAAVKQQAINAVKGKSHLMSTDGTAGDDIVVPKDTLELYKALNPKATIREIKEDYAKRLKEKGR